MKVISVSEMYALFNVWNDGQWQEDLEGQEVLLVNRRTKFIIGKVKIMLINLFEGLHLAINNIINIIIIRCQIPAINK